MAEGPAGARSLRRLLQAMVGLADLDLQVVLERIIEAATDLVDAEYGALGVLDPTHSYLSQFITVGVSDEQRAKIGDLPRGHGILGLLIVRPEPIRLTDIREHADSYGIPPNHPKMSSFLGVPVFVRGEVFGNLYLTDKRGGGEFTDVDEELAVGLASAAAVAIDNARLHERMRDLALVEDRERIARDLHDTVIQRLFATGLSLQASARMTDDPRLVERIEGAVEDLDATVREIRSAIFELNQAAVLRRSVRRDLLGIGAELADALGAEPSFRFDGPVETAVDEALAPHVTAVVREGLTNAAKHAGPGRVHVDVSVHDGMLDVVVADEGPGPGPARAGGHGLANLHARAEKLGGSSELLAGSERGSVLHWQVPVSS